MKLVASNRGAGSTTMPSSVGRTVCERQFFRDGVLDSHTIPMRWLGVPDPIQKLGTPLVLMGCSGDDWLQIVDHVLLLPIAFSCILLHPSKANV